MKNSIQLFAITSVLVLSACGPAKVEETQTPPATPTVTNETTIIKTETAKTPVAAEPKKSTSITINKDGSSIETKNGDNQTKVELSKDKSEVIIKR